MIALAIFALGAATGSVLTWVVMAFRSIGPSRVTREPPRMVVLPPTALKRRLDGLRSFAPAPALGAGPAGRRLAETERGGAP